MTLKKQADPIDVEVANEEPLKVEIGQPENDIIVDAKGKSTLAPTTTEQEDIVAAGQRTVNLIWEFTQSGIASSVTLAIVYTSIIGVESANLQNAFFLIVGFYFSRTNHQATGGVGKKPMLGPYKGR